MRILAPTALFIIAFAQFAHGYLDPSKNISQFGIARWELEDGLHSNWISQISQKSGDPSIWMGTPTGLVRFDGATFNVFDIRATPLLAGGAWALETDQNGRLWIGTRTHGIIYYDNGVFSKIDDPGLEDLPEVRSLHADSRGWLWIGTPAGLYVYKDGSVSAYDYENLNSAFITFIHEDSKGFIWVGTQDQGLFHLTGDSSHHHPVKDLEEFKTIYSACSDQRGDLWVGTKSGVFQLRDCKLIKRLTVEDGLPSNNVRALHLDRSGSLIIGTESGLVRYNDGSIIEDRSLNPFAENFITCFHEDAEGSLWVGTKYTGLAQLWSSKFTVYSLQEGLKNSVVNVTYEDKDGTVWIGTNQGIHTLVDDKITEAYQESLGELRIRDICIDSKGNTWVCTYSGLFKISEDEVVSYRVKDGLTSNLVRQVLEDRTGRIWIGTRSGLALIEDGEMRTWKTPELLNDLILHIFEDRKGNIWITTDGSGIARFENDSFHWYTMEQGLANGVVFRIHEDSTGLFWLTTSGGISVFDGKTFKNLGIEDGLPSQTIFQTIEDPFGSMWLTAHEGIFKIQKLDLLEYLNEQRREFEVTRYGKLDGLRTYQMTGVGESSLLSDGRLCFSTADGIAILDLAKSNVNAIKPVVHFEKVVVNGEPFFIKAMDQNKLTFGPGVKTLQIDFTSNSLIGASNILFSYRLFGFDDDFTESNARSVSFTNLSPGDYRFEVRARNADGIWGHQTGIVEFEVLPFFHQTYWFYLLIIILSMVGGYGIYSIRLLHLRRLRSQLKRKVAERTAEITRQKEIIESKGLENEKTLRALQASNRELKKLSEEKSYFLGVAAHDMKNPLGIMMALSEELVEDEEASTDEIPSLASIIHQSTSDLLELVNTLVHSISLESGKMQLEKDSEDIAALAASVIALNQKSAGTKNISLSLEGPSQLIGYWDSLRLRTAIDNYISNAIKYTPPDGSVTVSLRELKEPDRRYCEFSVIDSGPGLKEEDFNRAFERFAKLSARPTGGESSSGLGLSIVKQIIELHGGTVDVVNNPEAGACFSFRIPLG